MMLKVYKKMKIKNYEPLFFNVFLFSVFSIKTNYIDYIYNDINVLMYFALK